MQLKGFEMARGLRLVAEPFTLENDLLTPTFKLKRNVAKKVFQGLIDEMYGSADMETVAGVKGLRQGAAGGAGGK